MTTPKSVQKWNLHISEGLMNGSVQICCDITTYWTSMAFSILTSQKLNSSPFLWKPVRPSYLNKWYNQRFNHITGNLAASLILSLFLSLTSNYFQVPQIVPATRLVNSSHFLPLLGSSGLQSLVRQLQSPYNRTLWLTDSTSNSPFS